MPTTYKTENQYSACIDVKDDQRNHVTYLGIRMFIAEFDAPDPGAGTHVQNTLDF